MMENSPKLPDSTAVLPENYKKAWTINLQTDKKLAGIVNGAALVVFFVMVLAGIFLLPIGSIWKNLLESLPRLIGMCLGMMAYIFLHEWVHGLVMQHYVPGHVQYGFTGLYAYAGSDAFYNKHDYIVIALAPVVVWGVVLLVLQMMVPVSWKWTVYMIQIMNISGACGDFYVWARFSKLPQDILVQDSGVEMTVYEP